MVKLLEPAEVDMMAEEVDATLTAEEERAAAAIGRPTPPDQVGDLSDGGTVHGVKVTPRSGWGGKKMEKGRPAARRAWTWDGTETVLALAWNPEGTRHDGARSYLLKRHCLCCHFGGFRGTQCPNCVKNSCVVCNASTDVTKIIPCFYLRQGDVPFPRRFFGDIDCFLPLCPRQGKRGFKTQEDMRVHARTRHQMEYTAYREVQAAGRTDEIAALRDQVNVLLGAQIKVSTPAPVSAPIASNEAEIIALRTKVDTLLAQQGAAKDRMAKARAGRKRK